MTIKPQAWCILFSKPYLFALLYKQSQRNIPSQLNRIKLKSESERIHVLKRDFYELGIPQIRFECGSVVNEADYVVITL